MCTPLQPRQVERTSGCFLVVWIHLSKWILNSRSLEDSWLNPTKLSKSLTSEVIFGDVDCVQIYLINMKDLETRGIWIHEWRGLSLFMSISSSPFTPSLLRYIHCLWHSVEVGGSPFWLSSGNLRKNSQPSGLQKHEAAESVSRMLRLPTSQTSHNISTAMQPQRQHL